MPESPDVVFLQGLAFFGGAVDLLTDADWERPSPCAGWRAVDVVGHVGSGIDFGTKLLRKEEPDWSPSDPPGDGVQGDPAGWWRGLTGPARSAVEGADLDRRIESPVGSRTIAEGLRFPALDLFIHAWDLARTIGDDVTLPDAVIEFAHAAIDPLPDERVRSAGVFGAEQPVPPGATPTQICLAWTGRDPLWTPPVVGADPGRRG